MRSTGNDASSLQKWERGSILRRVLFWALLLYVVTASRTSSAGIHQILITGTVDFVGCPDLQESAGLEMRVPPSARVEDSRAACGREA